MKKAIDKQIESYLDAAIKDAQKKDPLIALALEQIRKIALAGGKRIRGALLCQAYFGFGGKDKRKILKAAAAIELVHLFLLVHDDIIDRGETRHGQETLHKMLAKKYQKKYGKDKARHFGDSMAIIAGDMLYAMANRIIIEAGFEDGAALLALAKLQSVVNLTIIGQSQDINIAYNDEFKEKDVLAMYENKTARYTFEGPLHIGALLAGCNDKKSLDALSCYAIPLGIAFQIQDDILGVFGEEKKTGKSAASDIEEGKKTLLVVKALSKASPMEIKKISAIFGKDNLAKKEIKAFQELLVSTGSLEYNKDLAAQYFAAGKNEIEKTIILPEAKKFLIGLAQYLEKREI